MAINCGQDCTDLEALFGTEGTGLPECYPDALPVLDGALSIITRLLCDPKCIRVTSNGALEPEDFADTLWDVHPAPCECPYLIVIRNSEIWIGSNQDTIGLDLPPPNNWINLSDISNANADFVSTAPHSNMPGGQALSTLGGPGLLKFTAPGILQKAIPGVDYAVPSGGGGPGTYVELTPGNSTVNTITPTGDYTNLTLDGTTKTTPYLDMVYGGVTVAQFNESGWLMINRLTADYQLDIAAVDAVNDDISTLVRIDHETSGVPVSGIGAAIQFESQKPASISGYDSLGRVAFQWLEGGRGIPTFSAAVQDNGGTWIDILHIDETNFFAAEAIPNIPAVYLIGIGNLAGGSFSPTDPYIALGHQALLRVGAGGFNIAIGENALHGTGDSNRVVAIGDAAGASTIADIADSVYIGYGASPAQGPSNSVIIGANASVAIASGGWPTANVVVLGADAIATDHDSVAIGFNAVVAGDHAAAIGGTGISDQYRLGVGQSAPIATFHGTRYSDETTGGVLTMVLEAKCTSTPDSTFGHTIVFKADSAINPSEGLMDLLTFWTDPATQESRTDFWMHGGTVGGAYIAMSMGASQTEALWACLGADPSPRQVGGAATAGVTYDAGTRAMIQKIYDAGRLFGWLT